MDGRHIDVTLESIREEQIAIDRLVDALLESSVAAPVGNLPLQQKSDLAVTAARSPNPGNRAVTRQGKKSGPQASPSPATVTTNNKHSYESIVNCLTKLNDQNKRLLSLVEDIAKKAEENKSVSSVEAVPSELIQETPVNNTLLDGVSERLEKI